MSKLQLFYSARCILELILRNSLKPFFPTQSQYFAVAAQVVHFQHEKVPCSQILNSSKTHPKCFLSTVKGEQLNFLKIRPRQQKLSTFLTTHSIKRIYQNYISIVDVSTLLKNINIDIDIDEDNLDNIDIDIDRAILENIDIAIDINKDNLENIDINRDYGTLSQKKESLLSGIGRIRGGPKFWPSFY